MPDSEKELLEFKMNLQDELPAILPRDVVENEQFFAIMDLPESAGRKLDFITQEMFRETNTIGSKANDVEISRHVVEIKAALERIREQIQNVE